MIMHPAPPPTSTRRLHEGAVAACLLLWPVAAQAQAVPDKSQYDLFDPTPDKQMRGFNTDRPGNSSEPFTVDAGHVQVETSLWSYSWDHWTPDSSLTRSYAVLDPELKLGVTNWADLEAILPLYNSLVTRTPGSGLQPATRSSGQGFGDVQLGAKVNVFGNDGKGDTGLGVLGFVKVPTAASGLGNGSAEFTLAAPYQLPLPADFSLTVEPALGLLRNGEKPGYHGDYQFIVNTSRQIPGTPLIASFGVTLDRQGDHNSAEQDIVSSAVQWLIGPALQLDAGVFIGLNRGATDWNPSVGISFRY